MRSSSVCSSHTDSSRTDSSHTDSGGVDCLVDCLQPRRKWSHFLTFLFLALGLLSLGATAAHAAGGEIHFYPRSAYASRMVGGKFQGSSDNVTYTDLYTISTTPTDGAWTTVTLASDPSTYRYLRYLSPATGYGNVAEIEFYSGTGTGAVKLNGLGFGTAGSYNNNGNIFAMALDGNPATYFDGPTVNGNYVGIDQQGQQMTLTSDGAAAGFSLTTFATGFPQFQGSSGLIGPMGIVFPSGTALITDHPGHVRVFSNSEADNQVAGSTPPSIVPTATYSDSNAVGLATVGGVTYMIQKALGQVVRVNSDGTLYATGSFVASIPTATGIAANPVSKHLFVTSDQSSSQAPYPGRIYDVNPATNTATAWSVQLNGPDGISISADGTTLYVAVKQGGVSDILGFRIADQFPVWDYNTTSGHIAIADVDGTALGYGNRLHYIYANTNSGTLYQIALPGGTVTPGTTTLIGSGGTRGDFVAVDTNGQGSLLLTQADRILRLKPFPPAACTPAGLSSLAVVDATGAATTSISASAGAMGKVTLASAALAGGEAVNLSSSSPIVSVPASVLVPGGSLSVSFPLAVTPPSATVSVTLTATYHGVSQTATVTVDGYAQVPQGGPVQFLSTGPDVPAGSGGLSVVDVVNPAHQVIASTGSVGLNGWSLSATYVSGGGVKQFTVQAPASAQTGQGYEIRSNNGPASAFFDVTPSGSQGGNSGVNGATGGLTLTSDGLAQGFNLTAFVTGFPSPDGVGPLGAGMTTDGDVLVPVSSNPEFIYRFRNMDGQVASQNLSLVSSRVASILNYGGVTYATLLAPEQFVELNSDGSVNRVVANVGGYGLDVNHLTGHFVVSSRSSGNPVYDVDPQNGAVTYLFAAPTNISDGLAVSLDGTTVYLVDGQAGLVYGCNMSTGTQAFSPILISGPDGLAVGEGTLSSYLFVNTNYGNVYEVNLANNQQITKIASGGSRGDLIGYSNKGELFLSQLSSVMRLIPPPGGSFGSLPSQAIYTRDDLTHSYASFGISGTATIGNASTKAAFNLAGVDGTVTASQMQRAGQITDDNNAYFDLQWGITSLAPSGPLSFGPVQVSADALPTPTNYTTWPFAFSPNTWTLPAAFNTDIQQTWASEVAGSQTGGVYQVSLTDQISSVCGSLNFADTPHSSWPQQKNILTVVNQPASGLPEIDQGRCLDIETLTGATPSYNYPSYWEILLSNKVIATSGAPNGWNAEPDQTSFGGVTVTVPASAAVSDLYQVNYVAASALSGTFGVTFAGDSSRTAILLPLVLSQSTVVAPGSVTGTVSLDAPAPRGGATVTLTASIGATVPASVLIAQNQRSATFTVASQSVASATSVQINASYNGYRSALLGVLPTGSSGGGGGGPGSNPSLPAPATLTASGGDRVVTLSWGGSTGATSYSIFRSATKGGGYALLFVGFGQTTYKDYAVTNGVTYYYVAVANNLYGSSNYSNEASATPLGGQVATPTITASVTSTNGVYPAPLSVTISDQTFGATIGYTVDGTSPTSSSAASSVQLSLKAGKTLVTAVGYKTGSKPSAPATATFVVADTSQPMLHAIACGSSASGTLTASSATSQARGTGFYADYYAFTGGLGDVKTITMASNAFDTYLVLRDPSGNVVATNDDAPVGTTSSTWTSQIVYTLLTSGTYTVEATSYTSGAIGPYTLTLACTSAAPQLTVTSNGTVIPYAATPTSPAPIGPALDYGTTPLGVPVSKTFLLQNTGTAPLTLSGVTVPSGFTVTSPLTSPILAGGSEPVVLRFDATQSASSSNMSFVTNDPLYAAGTTTSSYYFAVQGSTSGTSSQRPQVPQNGSNTFPLNYAVTGLPAGGWYIQDPSGKIVGTNDPAYGSTNTGWTVSLAADSTTVTVGAPSIAPVLTGYNVYVTQGTPNNAATFDVVASAVPLTPLTLAAKPGNAQVTLSWNAAQNATSYNLYRGTTQGGEGATPYKPGLTGTAFTDTGLTNGMTYYYQITAANSVGEGTRSNEVPTTPQALATPVLTAVGGAGLVNLSWGSITGATSYNVYRGTSLGGENLTTPYASVTAPTITYADSAVNNGTSYYYKIKAIGSGAAVSNYSNEASATPQAQAAPVLLTAVPGNGQVTLTWSSITGARYYQVYYGTTAGGPYSFYNNASVTTLSVSSLTNGVTYYFVVLVNTSSGNSAYSNELSATPNLPLNLTAQPGNALVQLTWSAAWTTATNSPTYNLYRGTTAGGEATTPVQTGLTGTSYTDPGLTNGTTYYYQMTAVNSAGNEGAKSNEASAKPIAVPAAPLTLKATAGNTQVGLTWSSVTGATSYNVKRGTAHGGPYTTVLAVGNVTAYIDTGLTNGTTYYYVVTAVNASGESPSSNEASATPIAPPDTPLNLSAVGGNNQVQLLWSASARAAGYNIYRGTTAGGESLVSPMSQSLTTAFTDTTAVNGTTYYYVVRAVNAAGVSTSSNEASATPQQGSTVSPTITASYTAGPLATRVIPNNGKFNLPSGTTAQITLQSATPGAKLYYTLGTPTSPPADPTTSSALYNPNAPPSLTGSTVIKALATAIPAGYSNSLVATGTYLLNSPPAVSLSSPNGTSFHTGDNVPLLATVSDTDGAVTQVNFFATPTGNPATQSLVGTATSNPFQITWANVPQGTYNLTAVAIDNDGGTATSSPALPITVSNLLTQTTIACNQIFSGSLKTSDGASTLPGFSDHFADQYTFAGTASQTVTLSLSSTAFDTYLALKDPSGTVIKSNDDASSLTHNSQVVYTLPSTIPGSGIYTIEVTSAASGATGAYTLEMDCAGGGAAPAIGASYQVGSTITPITSGGTAVDFGAVPANTPVLRTVTLKNTGTADLNLTGITSSDSHFTLTSSPSSPVVPGQSTSFTISYSAADVVTRTATVTLTNNSAINPFVINLSANSQTPPALTVSSIAFIPGTVSGGASSTGTVTLSGNAPAGGQSVSLSSSNTTLLTVIPSVIVPAGKNSITFVATPPETASGGTVTVTASFSGGGSKTGTLTITASQLVSVSLSPGTVTGGTSSTGMVTLRNAPPSATTVILAAPNSLGVTVPSSVVVAANTTTKTFSVTTSAVTSPSTVTMTATLASISKTATLTVNPFGTPPTVSITNTTNNGSATTSFTAPANITINASATAAGSATIQKVAFYESPDGGTTFVKLGEDTATPYSFLWSNAPAGNGNYSLKAVATDSHGLQQSSALYAITVAAAPQVPMPVITPGGSFTGLATVSMTDSQAGAAIFYTLGTPSAPPADPTPASAQYLKPLWITTTTVVKAKAFQTGYPPSTTNTQTYTLSAGTTSSISVQITGPVPALADLGVALLTQPTAITGTVTSSVACAWEMDYRPVQSSGSGQAAFIPFASGTFSGAVSGSAVSGMLDTTLLLNGQYEVRLSAVTAQGLVATPTASIFVRVQGGEKVGYFTLSYNDLTLPVPGLPIQITRTYDSRDKSAGDFGTGWTLSSTNVKLQKNGPLGYNWNEVYNSGLIFSYSVVPQQPHVITITFPDGTVYNFAAVLSPDTQPLDHLKFSNLVYQALPGTPGTLTAINTDFNVTINTGLTGVDTNSPGSALELFTSDDTQLYDCDEFQLTLPDGRILDLNDTQGLQWVQDANGNTLKFTYNGTRLSGINSYPLPGRSVSIARDGTGRITEIDDPNGGKLLYGSTDGLNNLTSFTDRANNITTFDYDALHNLTGIHDPRGILPIRNYYRADGRLDYSLDAHNQKIQYTYDSNLLQPGNHTETVVDRLGNSTVLTYDTYGNVTQTQKMLYDLQGNFLRTVTTVDTFNLSDAYNPNKKTSETVQVDATHTRLTNYSYDGLGDVLQIGRYRTYGDYTLASSFTAVATIYDGAGRPLTVTDALENPVSRNQYDGAGNLQWTKDALGHETDFYYTNGLLTLTKDAQLHPTSYGYDAQGDVSSVTDAQYHVTQFGYDNNGNKTSQTTTRTNSVTGLPETLVTQFFYDSADRLVKTIAPDLSISRTYYNSIGKVDHTVDAAGRTTYYFYDELGQLIQTQYPDGTSTYTAYDANGQRITSQDKAGRMSATVYDSLGRTVQSGPVSPALPYLANGTPNWLKDANNVLQVSMTAYDDAGEVLSETDPLGNTSGSTYDALGRKTQSTDAFKGTTKYYYDDDDRQKSVVDALNHATSYDYDIAGRLKTTYYQDQSTSSTEYDELGRRISQTDQANHTTGYSYDTLGRLATVTTSDPRTQVTTFGYDELGEKISQTDANLHTTKFAYDLRGRLLSKLLPGGQSDGRTYDALGRLATSTDFNGRITTYGYDPLTGQLLSKTAGTEGVIYTYKGDGTRATATRTAASGSTVTTTYAYYPTGDYRQGQLKTVTTLASGGTSRTVTYDYDALGNKISTQTPSLVASGKFITYGYDALSRLVTVTHPDGAVTTFGYDKVGNRQSLTRKTSATASPFSTTGYTYDALNRLTDIVNKNGNNAIVSYYHYQLRADGKRYSVTESGPYTSNATTSYTYDDADKLTEENGPYADIKYTYDLVGNRQTRTVTGAVTGNGNTLTNGTTSYTYDSNDRIVTVNGTATHTYDNDGNEKTVNLQTATYDFENHLVSLGSVASYIYDAEGNRYSASNAGTTTTYVTDSSLSYASVVEEYTGSTPTLSARYDYGDDLIRMDRTTPASTSYYLFDGLGSTRQLVNTGGGVTDTYAYSAFGEMAGKTGSTANPFLFNAQQFDAASGDYYLRARYYDQSNGRFISQDPFNGNDEDPISLHRYVYADNDPTDLTDPGGEDPNFSLSGLSVSIGELAVSYGTELSIAGVGAQILFSFLYPDLAEQVAFSLQALPVINVEDQATVTVGKTARFAARSFENNALAITQELLGDAFDVIRSTPEDFRSLAQSVRQTLAGTVGRDLAGRNLAFAHIDISGLFVNESNTILGLSGDFDKAGFAPRLPEGFEGSAIVDSEKKIFDQLLSFLRDQNIGKEATGDIVLYSERRPCASCQRVIQQFRDLYPGVHIHVISSNLSGKIKLEPGQ